MTNEKWHRTPEGYERDGWRITRGIASGGRRAWWATAPDPATAPGRARVSGPYWSLAAAQAACHPALSAPDPPFVGGVHRPLQPAAWQERFVEPDEKPRRRIVDRAAGRAKKRHEHRCRCCQRPAHERHHIVPRSQGGDDVDANIVPLCFYCHQLVTRNDGAMLQIFRAALTPIEEEYVIGRKGEAWLDRRYPR